jgi:FixJ family two-component response regulator
MQAVPPLIAVVDDEEPVRTALSRLLRSRGLRVIAFRSGEEFLRGLDHQEADCALLDLRMPGVTGIEVLDRLRVRGSRVRVVVMTAHDEPSLKESCISKGAIRYLLKPMDSHTLMEAIADALGRGEFAKPEGRSDDGRSKRVVPPGESEAGPANVS